MGVFQRVSDILSANLNDLLERFESPEALLKQAIREMDAAISRQMSAAAKAVADERISTQELRRLREAAAQQQGVAHAAVTRGDDDAARSALLRRQEFDRLIAALEHQCAEARATREKLLRQLDAMRIRRREADQSWRLWTVRSQSNQSRRQLAPPGTLGLPQETGFQKFERWRSVIAREEVETDALLELAAERSPNEEAPLATDEVVEAELARLKQLSC
jgi:phage shock protein A